MSSLQVVLPAALLSAFWLSVALGLGLGALYVGTSFLANRYAVRQEQRRFMVIVLGGMLVRILVALVLVALALLLLPVKPGPFIGCFFIVFVIGLVGEVRSWLRWPATHVSPPPTSDGRNG